MVYLPLDPADYTSKEDKKKSTCGEKSLKHHTWKPREAFFDTNPSSTGEITEIHVNFRANQYPVLSVFVFLAWWMEHERQMSSCVSGVIQPRSRSRPKSDPNYVIVYRGK